MGFTFQVYKIMVIKMFIQTISTQLSSTISRGLYYFDDMIFHKVLNDEKGWEGGKTYQTLIYFDCLNINLNLIK